MRMISIFRKIPKSGAMASHAHSLTFYAGARLNRYPHITDAGGSPFDRFGGLGGSVWQAEGSFLGPGG